MRIGDLLVESRPMTLFHGDDFGTTFLDPKWMLHSGSRNQEGVGIYFSPDVEVALQYGEKVSYIELSSEQRAKIVDSRAHLLDVLDSETCVGIFKALMDHSENFWYIFSDYGIEVAEPTDVDDWTFASLYEAMLYEEVRNFQITLCEYAGVESFVRAWNETTNIIGTHEKTSNFYAIIDTTIEAKPFNW